VLSAISVGRIKLSKTLIAQARLLAVRCVCAVHLCPWLLVIGFHQVVSPAELKPSAPCLLSRAESADIELQTRCALITGRHCIDLHTCRASTAVVTALNNIRAAPRTERGRHCIGITYGPHIDRGRHCIGIRYAPHIDRGSHCNCLRRGLQARTY